MQSKLLTSILGSIEDVISDLPYAAQEPKGLYTPIAYALDGGGKRIRPLLACLAAQTFCGDYKRALIPAVALEIYHNHTLLHDDLMDRSPLRRGKPTVYTKWNENTAILSGDAMLISAFSLLGKMDDKPAMNRLFPLFCNAFLNVCEGQQSDVDFEQSETVTPDDYLRMIDGKTSALLSLSMQIGAITAGAPTIVEHEAAALGKVLGRAFQLEDDLLDVFSTPEVLGKPIGGDIVNGKKTMLLLLAYATARETDKEDLIAALKTGDDKAAEKISRVRALYIHLGVDKEVGKLINECYTDAESSIMRLRNQGFTTDPLEWIVQMLRYRKK